MKLLVVSQYYYPEPFNVSDICEELQHRGHDVTVLTGLPNYPEGEYYPGYEDGRPRNEELNGVRLMRVKELPRKTGAKDRVLNYLSFWRSAKSAAKKLPEDFDVALAYELSPIMQADAGIVWARKHSKKCLLYCLDLWPASLTAGGFSKKSLAFRWMGSVSKRIYSQADRLAITSPLFDEYFRNELGLNLPDSLYLPQYADDVFAANTDLPIPDGYDPSNVNLTFAGNVGQAQSVETIVRAAKLTKNARITYHVVGSGSCLKACQKLAQELNVTNLTFHGRKPLEEMPTYYAASDAMLVTFEASPMATYTLPRKATTYLAAGQPILAALDGETKRVIDEARCGLTCGTADAEGLARIAAQFAAMDNKQTLGQNAREYYEKHFTKAKFVDALEAELMALAGKEATQ